MKYTCHHISPRLICTITAAKAVPMMNSTETLIAEMVNSTETLIAEMMNSAEMILGKHNT
jgi:hypothetical protein